MTAELDNNRESGLLKPRRGAFRRGNAGTRPAD